MGKYNLGKDPGNEFGVNIEVNGQWLAIGLYSKVGRSSFLLTIYRYVE